MTSSQKHFTKLKKRFDKHHTRALTKFNQAGELAMQAATAGALAGTLALTGPSLDQTDGLVKAQIKPPKLAPTQKVKTAPPKEPKTRAGYKKENLVYRLSRVLPGKVQDLNAKEEQKVEQILRDTLKVDAKVELNQFRLNTDYGFMGAEQHLPRFVGDTAAQHGAWVSPGITATRGAWGFVPPKLEKYYFAVQTFRSPMWDKNFRLTYDWFKWRKMIAVNSKTGDAVVGVVADAGPATWTGKQFGGSPEVMEELNLHTGMRKGEVLLFFVDDYEDRVPLGPVQ